MNKLALIKKEFPRLHANLTQLMLVKDCSMIICLKELKLSAEPVLSQEDAQAQGQEGVKAEAESKNEPEGDTR